MQTSTPDRTQCARARLARDARFDGLFVYRSAQHRQRAEVPGSELTLRLSYRPPLDLPAMLAFLQRRAIPGIEQIDDGGYRHVIGKSGNRTLIQVSAAPQRAELSLR